MKYETVKFLKDAAFKRSTGVSGRVFEQMPQLVEKGQRSFGRPSKLSRANQLLLTLMYWREYRAEFHMGLTYHDFQLLKDSHIGISKHVGVLGNAGYQGIMELHTNSQIPFKKTKLHPLTQEQKASNRALSRKRILIENIICRLKIFRIFEQTL